MATSAEQVIQRFDGLKTKRSIFERQWQEIRELVRPATSDFTRSGISGERRAEFIYDGTAAESLYMFAAFLHSSLANPVDRWFTLSLHGMDDLRNAPDVLEWLEQVSDLIFDEYNNEDSGLNSAIHELLMDVGAFGTGVIYQTYDRTLGCLNFRTFPLADCYLEENWRGHIDGLSRSICWSSDKISTAFSGMPGFKGLPVKLAEFIAKDKKNEKEWTVVHAVYPRNDRTKSLLPYATNKPYASCWVCRDTMEVIYESGFDSFPYHAPRWAKIAGDNYGQSPAMQCLPDIKMVNKMDFTIIKAAQKIVDPPLQYVSDGFLGQIETSPGALIPREPGVEPIEPLLTGANIPIGLELTEQKRQAIRQAFFASWIEREFKKERQTAFEIQDERNEMLTLMAPSVGRMQAELQSPLVSRSYSLLLEAGRIPPPPASLGNRLANRRIKVGYSSPASRAQLGVKASTLARYLQTLTAIGQIDPSAFDGINVPRAAQELARWMDCPRSILRSDDEIAQVQEQRQQQQAVATLGQNGEPLSKTILNLAEARKNGGIGL